MSILAVEFKGKADTLLNKLVKQTGQTKANLVRQGIILRDYFEKQIRQGKHVSVVDDNGKVEKEIVLS